MTKHLQLFCLLTLAAVLLASCAPTAAPTSLSPAAQQVEQAAVIAYHRMEIGRLQLGTYTTNVLVDLELPQGARWTLADFSDDDYALRFVSENLPEVFWLVTPRGVSREQQVLPAS